MQHYLHANERRAARYLPRGFKESAFLRFWTLKEVFAKSTAAGMNLDFAGIDFSSAKDGKAWVNRVTGQQCVLYTSKFQRLGLRANGWLSFAITILIINLKLHKLERHDDMLQEEQRVLRISR
jgi:phosphopantetheinyl transferase